MRLKFDYSRVYIVKDGTPSVSLTHFFDSGNNIRGGEYFPMQEYGRRSIKYTFTREIFKHHDKLSRSEVAKELWYRGFQALNTDMPSEQMMEEVTPVGWQYIVYIRSLSNEERMSEKVEDLF